jgi:hypothetical protein
MMALSAKIYIILVNPLFFLMLVDIHTDRVTQNVLNLSKASHCEPEPEKKIRFWFK